MAATIPEVEARREIPPSDAAQIPTGFEDAHVPPAAAISEEIVDIVT